MVKELTQERLYRLYITEQRSVPFIAKKLGCSEGWLFAKLKDFDIPRKNGMGKSYKISTVEEAEMFFSAGEHRLAHERLTYVLYYNPDLINVKRYPLARYLGLSRATLSRTISEYKRRNGKGKWGSEAKVRFIK